MLRITVFAYVAVHCLQLSIPFRMLHGIHLCKRLVNEIIFQFLLGCYAVLNAPDDPEMFKLSIPFRMLQ